MKKSSGISSGSALKVPNWAPNWAQGKYFIMYVLILGCLYTDWLLAETSHSKKHFRMNISPSKHGHAKALSGVLQSLKPRGLLENVLLYMQSYSAKKSSALTVNSVWNGGGGPDLGPWNTHSPLSQQQSLLCKRTAATIRRAHGTICWAGYYLTNHPPLLTNC